MDTPMKIYLPSVLTVVIVVILVSWDVVLCKLLAYLLPLTVKDRA